MVHNPANEVNQLFMGRGAFLDNLFDPAAKHAAVFLCQVLGR
jgi:hypothetical protein